jgi:stage V sporulation protein S
MVVHMERQKKNEAEDDVLRVSGGTSVQDLAATISHAIYDGRKPVLRAIGAGAVNQAVKGVAIAQSYVGSRGLVLSIRPGFTEVEMRDGTTTAIVLRVFAE